MNLIYMLTNRAYSITRGVIISILGILLLIWPTFLTNLIVQIIAAFSLAIGLVLLTMLLVKSSKKDLQDDGSSQMNVLNILNVIIYLLIGTLIFLYPDFFIEILVYFFGAILVILGVVQLLNLIFSSKYSSVSALSYIIAIIVTLCGILLFFKPLASQKIITMFFGGVLLLLGVSEIIAASKLKKVFFNENQ